MNLKPMALALIAALAAGTTHAEPIATVNIPRVSCRVPACEAVGTVQLSAAAPVGTQLRRSDGATFTTQVAGPGAVPVSSVAAIYDVPAGEVLVGPGGLTAAVTGRISRYVTGDSAGPVRFQGVNVAFNADGTRTPASLSLSYGDDFPAEFLLAVRQFNLTQSLVNGTRNQGLSLAATRAIVEASFAAPRPAATEGTVQAVTAFAHNDPARTTYAAPRYTEQRIAGPLNTRQAIAECGSTSTGACISRVGYVRPENLATVSLHCRNELGGIDGDCAYLRAHEFVRYYGVVAPIAGRCLADAAEPQRVFFGWSGDTFGCRTVYGGDVLPPEAEELIFEIVRNDLQ